VNTNKYQQPGQTGIILNEPNDVYHADPAISNSDLSLFLSDPKRFEAIRKGEIEREHKACYDLGDLFHTVTLEGVDVYQSKYVHESLVPAKPTPQQLRAYEKFPGLDKPTKAQREAFEKQERIVKTHEAFWKHHEGKRPIKADDDAKARAMRDSLWADDDAVNLLTGWQSAYREITLRTEETRFGFPVQVKLDYFEPDTGRIVDLKSVRNLDVFRRNFADFGYYRQAAFYSLVCELVTGVVPEFYFAAVEAEAPHEVAIFQAHPEAIETGIAEITAGLTALGQCLRADAYPKRFRGVQALFLKPWEVERAQGRVDRVSALEGDA
jgi:exodeoxyribonuclease VIII